MLKIDNVDLKKLEKFGFKRNKDSYYKCKRNDYFYIISYGVVIEVQKDTGWISLDGTKPFQRKHEIIYQDKLYDLIKAGLVKKESE